MRGILTRKAYTSQKRRIIPACAGNTLSILCALSNRSNHPRLRGEYVAYALQRDIPWGSSPLARGILNRCVCKSYISRIIPAYAGNTKSDKYCQNLYWDHPRLCGEYLLSPSIWCVMLGSSSLVRGIRGRNGTKGLLDRIIPACAGNTFESISRILHSEDHPRLCGEYAKLGSDQITTMGSSPLVRGIHSKKLDFP